MKAFLALSALGMALAGCSDGHDTAALDPTGRVQEPIIGGNADTTHAGVVALLLTNGSPDAARCSGTIVKVAGTKGTILTAAHCFEATPTKVSITTGASFDAPDQTFTATKSTLYPTTSGQLFDIHHDLALVEFDGASAALTVTPLVPPSDYLNYAVGAPLTVVGYGRTSTDGTPTNSLRKNLALGFSAYQESWLLNVSPTGATCFGDSGGAVLDHSTGSDRLAAVTQGGSCNPGDPNSAVGFYQPEIAAWLRLEGFDEPDAPKQPDKADCTTDALCVHGACLTFEIEGDAGGPSSLDLCGAPLANNFVCARDAQCISGYCNPTRGACTPGPLDDAGAAIPNGPSTSSSSSSTSSSSSSSGDPAGTAPVNVADSSDSGCSSSPGVPSGAWAALLAVGYAVLRRRRRS